MIHSQNPLIPTGIRPFISTSELQLQVTDESGPQFHDSNTCSYLEDCKISTRWERRARSRLSGAFIQSWKTKESRVLLLCWAVRAVAAPEKQLKPVEGGEHEKLSFFCNAACRHWEVPAGAGKCSCSSIPEEQAEYTTPSQILDPGDAVSKPNLVL